MKNMTIARRTMPALALAFLLPAGLVARQDGALPPASEIIDRYHEAIGGKERLRSYSSSRSVGSFEMAAAGIRGEIEVVAAKPNRMVMRISMGGMGEMRNGFDGEVAWSLNPMEGPRVLQGAELQQMKDQADFEAQFRRSEMFDTIETVENAEYGGEACYKVRLVWKSGRESFDCYSIETGLLVASLAKSESPMGTVDVTTLLSEYKDFNGIKTPTRMVQQMMGMEQVFSITEVEYDTVDDSAFELPDQIKALVQG